MGQLTYPFAWEVQVSGPGGTTPSWAAQEVSIPPENATLTDMAPENRGGAMPWPGVIQRESFLARPLTVNFFDIKGQDPETMARKWMIDISEQGFAAGGDQLFGSVICILHDNGGGRKRKDNAKDAYPTNVEGFTVSYGSGSFVVKSVTFACKTLDVG